MAEKTTVADTPTIPVLAGLTAEQLKECLELGATLAEIKELATAGFGFEAIASMASLLVQNRSSGGDMGRMMTILETQAQNAAVQNERTRPKENQNYIAQSMFLKPNGEPLAKDLACDVFFGSIHMNRTPLTREEVDALNLLRPLDRGHITKTDGSPLPVSIAAKVTATGKIERLTVKPESDEKNLNLTIPAITAWARELAAQAA